MSGSAPALPGEDDPGDPRERWDPSLVRLARAVEETARKVHLVARATPLNWDEELARLSSARRAGGELSPRFVYGAHVEDDAGLALLEDAATSLVGAPGPAGIVGERAAEAALESRLARAVGTRAFAQLARVRFGTSPAIDARAARWASHAAASHDEEPRVLSDDESDPASLVSALRRAVGELRLPVRIVPRKGMAALAAAGDGLVCVAMGRPLTRREVARTVVHELEGHVLPAQARKLAGHLPFRPAGAADREEGRALACERAAGFLDRERRKELGLRHVAACLAHEGAPFAAVVARLEELGAAPMLAVRVAARALRGGGLGRERAYLAALFALDEARGAERS